MMVNVRNGGEVSDTFAITNGVKQGSILAPTLFSIFLSAMLEGFRRHEGHSLHPITPECRPIYSCTLQSGKKKHKYTCQITAFTDDSALIVHSAKKIQRIIDAFATASSKFGQTINIKKIEVMFQPNSTTAMEEDINVADTTRYPVQ